MQQSCKFSCCASFKEIRSYFHNFFQLRALTSCFKSFVLCSSVQCVKALIPHFLLYCNAFHIIGLTVPWFYWLESYTGYRGHVAMSHRAAGLDIVSKFPFTLQNLRHSKKGQTDFLMNDPACHRKSISQGGQVQSSSTIMCHYLNKALDCCTCACRGKKRFFHYFFFTELSKYINYPRSIIYRHWHTSCHLWNQNHDFSLNTLTKMCFHLKIK